MTETDVIVIGAGTGAACAWQLAKRGQRVTLVDDGNAAQRRQEWAIWCVWMTIPPNLPSQPGPGALAGTDAPHAGKLRLARVRHAVAGGNAAGA